MGFIFSCRYTHKWGISNKVLLSRGCRGIHFGRDTDGIRDCLSAHWCYNRESDQEITWDVLSPYNKLITRVKTTAMFVVIPTFQ